MHLIRNLAGAVLMLTPMAPASAQSVMAICNDPKGRGFQVSPAKGWVFDRVKNGVLIFSRDKGGRPEIMIRDTKRSTNLARDGVKLTVTHHSRDYSYFIITAVYQRAQVDTFQVNFLPNGKGRLIWSSTKSHQPPRDETNGTFLVAECSR